MLRNVRSVVAVVVCLWGLGARAQAPELAQDTLLVFGTVMDYSTREPLTSFEVRAVDVKDPNHVVLATLHPGGQYGLPITESRTYRIIYTAKGRIPKQVEVAVAGPSNEQWENGYRMNVDILLMLELPGFDAGPFMDVFGRAAFNPVASNYEWDRAYTKMRMERMKKQLAVYDERLRAMPQ